MNNYSIAYMPDSFEQQKNTRATIYTGIVTGLMLLLFFLLRWPLPTMTQPLFEDGIEVNLGSSDQGLGIDQPMIPGEPSPSQQLANNPPKTISSKDANVKNIETDDRNADAPEIVNPPVSKPLATKINTTEKITRKASTPQVVAAPPAPKPKAVLNRTVGGTGTGGNGAETYQKGTNEGIAGGTGDQGVYGGTPGAPNYSGNPGKGNSGVSITRGLGGRNIIGGQSFEDEFNQNAKIAMDIVVSSSGKVISATYQPRGSTSSNGSMISIARRRANELKFNTGDDEQRGTILFNFKLKS